MHQEITEERKALTPKLEIAEPIRRLPKIEAPNPYSGLLKMYQDPQTRGRARSIIIMQGVAHCVQKILSNQDICPKEKN